MQRRLAAHLFRSTALLASRRGASSNNEAPFSLIDVMGEPDTVDVPGEDFHHGIPSPTLDASMPSSSPNLASSWSTLVSSKGSKGKHSVSNQRTQPTGKPGHDAFTTLDPAEAANHKAPAHGTSEDVKRAVRDAVLRPLGVTQENTSADSGGASPSASPQQGDGEPSSVSVLPLTVRISDKFGMPAELPRGAPRTMADLLGMCASTTLKEQLQAWLARHRIHDLTQVQQSTIPFLLEYRDVLCIAPTATGKTFTYAFPTMLRLTMDEASAQLQNPSTAVNAAGEDGDGDSDAAPPFARRDVEALLQEQINKGEVCRYCELRMAENPICPMTGVPHPPPPSDVAELALNTRTRRAVRLEELSTTAEPRVLVLVPNSQLAFQVYGVFKAFHADYTVRYMVRASSAEEQKRFLQALEGTDVLISTPETILPAMYKQKLSLKRVKVLVLDEIDDLVSTNHFEKLKIILGALPKGAERPQRLLFGASLPPVAYNMLKEKMLQPSHRFVLADVTTDHLGHPVRVSRTAGGGNAAANASSATLLTSPNNGGITHVVFMLGRIEKLQKLAWLYQTGRLTLDQRTIIFCNSRNNVAYVRDHLRRLVPGLHITTLSSRASVTAREGVLRMFSTGVSTCLVSTDLLSRGIDLKGVTYVVHYDMPTEMETWVHRNGRCGRHGRPGYVYTFFQPENIKMSKPLTAYLRQNRQLVPPKLQEYAKQSFIDVFRKSNFHHPTRPYRRDDPQNTTPVLGRGTPRFPDYRQEGVQKNFRPL